MKKTDIVCDTCGAQAFDELVVLEHGLRRDFCSDACFDAWKRRTSQPAQTSFGIEPRALKFEPATDWDIWTVHEWNNAARAQSFSTASIPRTAHQDWWPKHRENITLAWLPVGCARVEDGEISVVVDSDHRAKGYGAQLIRAVSEPNTLARVKEDNGASLRAFKNARYVEINHSDGVVEMVWPGLH